jgi:hypothetical protein
LIVINSSTRQFNIPGADLVFGVTADSGSEIKHFRCPRYVGNNVDIASSFVRINYQNANGEIDFYLVKDVSVDGDNVTFSWELHPKVTMFKGNVSFVMCVTGPDTKVKWHTTLGRGQVLEGLEPDSDWIESETKDGVAALIAMVEAQTEAVENKGAEWVRNVQNEGTDQILAVQTAAETAEAASVAEIEAKGVNTRNSIPDDYTALSEAVNSVVRGKAPAIVCSAEGSAITVNDASDNYVQGLRIFGRSTQDGTPTPEAPVEIKSVDKPVVTVCGKNLVNTDSMQLTGNNINIPIFEGMVKLPLTFSWVQDFAKSNNNALFSLEVDGITRYFVAHETAGECKKVITAGEVLTKITVLNWSSSIGNLSNIQLELGDISTKYEPYSGQTLELTHILPGIPVASGGNYTDSDGQQWICDEIDLERGVYVQRLFAETIADFTKATSYTYDGLGTSCAVAIDKSVTAHTALCSHFVIAHKSTTVDRFNLIGKTIYFKLAGELSWEEWVARMSELAPVVIGVLDAPIETPLSETEIAAYRALHSNYPNTTVLNDSGAHMVVRYAADTKLYIDNKIAALVGGI